MLINPPVSRCAVFALAFMLLLSAQELCAHGGGHPTPMPPPYAGPAGGVAPNQQPPGSPLPPTSQAIAPTPAPTPSPTPSPTPAGPTPTESPTPGTGGANPPGPLPSGGAAVPAPAPGREGARPGGAGGGGGVARRSSARRMPSFQDWEYWWRFNMDAYLGLREKLHRVEAKSDSAEFFFGRRTQRVVTDTSRPSPELIRKNVVPALLASLKAKQADIRDSACIALGRVGGAAEVPILVTMLADRTPTVRQAAAIGLGLIQRREGIPPLLAVLEAGEQGSKLCGRRPGFRLRAQAAAALGLIGDSAGGDVKEALTRFSVSNCVDMNIKVNATVGLGLLTGDETYLRGLTEHLRDLAGNRSHSDFVRAHAVVALGRVLDRNRVGADDQVLSFLIRLGRRAKSNHVQRSVVITLGVLVKDAQEHPEAVRFLRHVLARSRDGASRNFAAIALGEIGGPAASKTLRDAVLMNNNELKAYGALGLGILCRTTAGDDGQDAVDHVRGLEALRVAFKKAKTPHLKAACAIALGLARDGGAGSLLLEAMKRTSDTELKGHLAVAIGMVNHRGAVDHLIAAMKHSSHIPRLNQRVVIGLGLMGTRQLIQPLIDELNAARSMYLVASITHALAFIGDRRAIEPLTALLMNPAAQGLSRAYACMALGSIGEEQSLPVLAPVFKDHNYLASTLCLMELANIR